MGVLKGMEFRGGTWECTCIIIKVQKSEFLQFIERVERSPTQLPRSMEVTKDHVT